jgi:hypothetical protein
MQTAHLSNAVWGMGNGEWERQQKTRQQLRSLPVFHSAFRIPHSALEIALVSVRGNSYTWGGYTRKSL